jgi:hypothetical protein
MADAAPQTPTKAHSMRIPSMLELNSMVGDDMPDVVGPIAPHVKMARRSAIQRQYSVDSVEDDTLSRSGSSFTQTFTRALYEHMRGN